MHFGTSESGIAQLNSAPLLLLLLELSNVTGRERERAGRHRSTTSEWRGGSLGGREKADEAEGRKEGGMVVQKACTHSLCVRTVPLNYRRLCNVRHGSYVLCVMSGEAMRVIRYE